MIEKTFVLHTEEQAKKLAKIFNASNYVWGACVDRRTVIVSFYNEAGSKWGKQIRQKFDEVYDND